MAANFCDYLSRFHIYVWIFLLHDAPKAQSFSKLHKASLPRVCFYSVLLLEEHSWTLTAEVFENMTTYVVRSVRPTVSTLSSKAEANQTQWYSTRTFPSPTSNHIFFHLQAQKNRSRSHHTDGVRLAAQDRTTTVTQQETRGGRVAAGRRDEGGFSWTPPRNWHFSKPFSGTQHNTICSSVSCL